RRRRGSGGCRAGAVRARDADRVRCGSIAAHPDHPVGSTGALMDAGVRVRVRPAGGASSLLADGAQRCGGFAAAGGPGIQRRSSGIRSALVVAQLSVALMLLVGAGLLVRGFERLLAVDPRFNPHHLVTVTTMMPRSVRSPEQADAIYRRISDA